MSAELYGTGTGQSQSAPCLQEQDTLWEESRRLDNPHQVYVDLSQKLYDTKLALLAHGGQL